MRAKQAFLSTRVRFGASSRINTRRRRLCKDWKDVKTYCIRPGALCVLQRPIGDPIQPPHERRTHGFEKTNVCSEIQGSFQNILLRFHFVEVFPEKLWSSSAVHLHWKRCAKAVRTGLTNRKP